MKRSYSVIRVFSLAIILACSLSAVQASASLARSQEAGNAIQNAFEPSSSVTLYPTLDTYINQNDPNAAHGSETILRVSRDEFEQESRAMLKFSLAGIPAGSTINSAELRLYLRQGQDALPGIAVRRVLVDWPLSVTWNTRPSVAMANTAVTVVPPTVGYYSWDITQLVNQWVNQPATYPNHGLALVGSIGAAYYRNFDSVNASGTSTDPRLIINYTPSATPEPTLTPTATPIGTPAPAANECDSQTWAFPPLNLGNSKWIFVMNFEKVENGRPIGCLIYRTPTGIFHYISIPCNAVGNVALENGYGLFAGGHVFCDFNVKLSAPKDFPIQRAGIYDDFGFNSIGKLTLTSNAIQTHPFANPIGFYLPNDPLAYPAGFFVPLSAASIGLAKINSRFNDFINEGAEFPSSGLWRWQAYRLDQGETSFHHHSISMSGTAFLDDFARQEPVYFWNDGGTFCIGASPLGPSFLGALDEVLIDPDGSGRGTRPQLMTAAAQAEQPMIVANQVLDQPASSNAPSRCTQPLLLPRARLPIVVNQPALPN